MRAPLQTLGPLFHYGKNKRNELSNHITGGVFTRYNTQFTVKEGITAAMIADIIMEEYEDVLIDRCVRNRYDFFESHEKERIASLAKKIAKESGSEAFPGYQERKAFVEDALQDYLENNDTIVPGGFVDFRLRDVYYFVEQMVDEGADMYLKEKEYEEFTYLLSLFIAEKESSEEILHILWKNEEIRLINKRGRDVTVKYEKEFLKAAGNKGIGKEDLAISAVISAAPEKIVLHSAPENSPLAETLMKIFGEHCKACKGCNICKNS